MKKNFAILISLTALLLLASCSSDEDIAQSGNSGAVEATTVDFTIQSSDLETTRSTLSITDDGLQFGWEADDKLAVFAFSADSLKEYSSVSNNTSASIACYSICSAAGSNVATFTNTGFALKNGEPYYAFSPWDKLMTSTNVAPTSANLSYKGQRQLSNKNSDHLGAYDYQAGMAIAKSDATNFKFNHLGAVLEIIMMLPEAGTFNELDIQTAHDYEFKMDRTIDLTNQHKTSPSAYSPAFDAPKRTGSTGNKFALKLGQDGGGIEIAKNGLLYAYMMLPATSELKDSIVYAVLKGTSGNDYYCTFPGKDYEAGELYIVGRVAYKSSTVTENINVYKNWQNGTSVTRTSGDPGTTDSFSKPKWLTVYTCVDGVVDNVYSNATTDDDWLDLSTGDGWTLKTPLTPALRSQNPTNIHVYAFASNSELKTNQTIAVGTSEDVVRSATFSINSSDVDNSQAVLANTYAVPYSSSTNGYTAGQDDISTGDIVSITADLYHVAAKIDVNWEYPNSKVSAITMTNLLSTGYLFQPTENSAITSGGYSYSLNIGGIAQQHYGRDYFYTIQQKDSGANRFPASFTVTTGSGSQTENISFLSGTNKANCTSWFRANFKE